jgi:hypothetical protein
MLSAVHTTAPVVHLPLHRLVRALVRVGAPLDFRPFGVRAPLLSRFPVKGSPSGNAGRASEEHLADRLERTSRRRKRLPQRNKSDEQQEREEARGGGAVR